MITKLKLLQTGVVSMKISIDDIREYLLKNNIKPSYARIKILEYLVEKDSHPTVEEIYSNLVNEIPTLSKTTVYNTMKLLIDANIARIITIEENEMRYDADMGNHGHFKCNECGKIYDFYIVSDSTEKAELKNFKIMEKSVYYKGICQECLSNKK